jgi:oligopeptidase B
MKTPDRIYEYEIESKSKKLVKELEIPSGHDPKKYVVERLTIKSHDGTDVPITLVRKKDTNLTAKINWFYFLWSLWPFNRSDLEQFRFCLIDRGFIYAIAHVRGGKELGEAHHTEAIRLKKKNTFHDVIAVCNHLINHKYTHKGGICTYSGSAGGTTGAAVANMAPELFFQFYC